MNNIYLIIHEYGYDGFAVVGIKGTFEEAVEFAQHNLDGEYTRIDEYPIGWTYQDDTAIETVATWKRHVSRNEYKRTK